MGCLEIATVIFKSHDGILILIVVASTLAAKWLIVCDRVQMITVKENTELIDLAQNAKSVNIPSI